MDGTLAALVAVIALTGCGTKSQSGPTAPQPPAAQAPEQAPASPPAQPAATQPVAPVQSVPAPATSPAPPSNPPAVSSQPTAPPPAAQPGAPTSPGPVTSADVAEADGEVPGTRVEVRELKRSTNTVMLRFALSNNNPKSLDLRKLCTTVGVTADTGTVCSVNLVDAVGRKKYLTIHDSEGRCVCSGDLPVYGLAAGDSINLWAKFPAPPDSVQKISVVIPGFIPMDDVAISQ